MTLNLQRLQTFIRVVDLGGVTAAARALGIAQSSVSAAVSHLETDVAARLIERDARRFQVTDAGRTLVDHGRALLASADEVLDGVARARDAPVGGMLRAGATTTATEHALPRALAGFLTSYPDVDVDVVVARTEHIVAQVIDGALPFALIAGVSDDPRLVCEPIAMEQQAVIIAPDHLLAGQRVDPATLHGTRLLLRERGSGTREHQLRLAEQWQIPAAQHSTLTGTSAILAAVSHGLGITCLSRSVVEIHLRAGAVAEIELPTPVPARPISLIRRPNRTPHLIEELFLAHLKKGSSV
ncbi:LysR family transcriptional regulator [Microbacterium sp. ANT_H45B]|uniref:LysR family transcriptional regulator n=1 Tax=Microbacterium sp. ANT_H45B TaxID=2597346 RepID=UPI00165D7254|nr:LysR family transcriptional regulator [Microbacterium sp. ANT_H45B]